MRKKLMSMNINSTDNTSLEALMDRGVFDDRDIDYINHLSIPDKYNVSTEGIVKGTLFDKGNEIVADATAVKGWFLGMETKRKYIEQICEDLIDWLKDEEVDEPDLNLDMGAFKTWMKTSEMYKWRYYFLLNDSIWSKIETDLRNNKITDLEGMYNIDFKSRKDTTQELDSISDIKGLIRVVETYIKRSNKFFDLITKRQIKVKQAPFQVILLGASDLRMTLKKIVNLAT